MNCDCYLCIYQMNKSCTLNEVSVDNMGRCLEMILFSIDDFTLEKLKNETLKNYDDN